MAVTSKFRLSLPNYGEAGWDDDVNDNFTILDALLGQYISLTNIVGVWQTSTAYNVGNKVVDEVDSSVWECLIAHTSASSGLMSADRTLNPTYWESSTTSLIEAAASAAAAEAAADLAVGAAATTANMGVYKNAIINGAMDIWQRGSSLTPTPGVTYLADKWRTFFNGTGGTTTVSRADSNNALCVDAGIVNAMRYNVSVLPTTPTGRQLAQDIEGVETFSGRQITISYYAWVASGTLVPTVYLSQNMGTGGSPSANVDQTVTFPQFTTTPQRFSHTATLGSIFGKTLGSNGDDKLSLVFFLPAAQTFDMYITGVQVELGSTATPFSYRPISAELELCKRFYQLVEYFQHGYGTIGNSVRVAVNHPVTMRATPTATIVGAASNTNITGPAVATSATQSNYGGTCTATGAYVLSVAYSHSAELS